jgi:splicing factor 1
MMEGDDEPLHVVITGEDQGSVDAATDMIHQMLVVIDDEKNVHKQSQLRELALLNGTLKEEEFCQICAEKGHRAFECPKRFSNKTKIQVRCAICGDTSHPTRDCTQKATPELEGGKNKQELDSDYANFMAELDGKKVEAKKPDLPPVTPAAAVPPAAYSEPVGAQQSSNQLFQYQSPLEAPLPCPSPPPAMLPPPPGFSALAPPPPPNLPPPPPVQYGGYPPPLQQQQHAPPAAFIQQQGYR